MSQESIALSQDQISFLREKYKVPAEAIRPEITNALHALYQYEHEELNTFPDRLDKFHDIAEEILSAQLSKNNIKLLYEVCNGVIEVYSNHKSILNDAKELFKIHVGSLIKDTIKSLRHGSALEKLGASLAFVGKALDGISTFWNELVKKHKILKMIDICVVTPLVISFYTTIIPELAIIKACEFVGRTMIEKARTGEWKSSIFSVASTMIDSTTKHFERLLGTSYQLKLVNSMAGISNLGGIQKDVLNAVLSSDKSLAMVTQFIQHPKTAAATVAGAMLGAKVVGMEVKDCLKIMQEILYSEKIKEPEINIEDFCKRAESGDKIATDIAKVFRTDAGHLPKALKSLSDIIEATQNSTKIEDKTKPALIQFFVAYAIKNEVDKRQAKDQGESKEDFQARPASHVKKEEIRRETKATGLDQGELGRN